MNLHERDRLLNRPYLSKELDYRELGDLIDSLPLGAEEYSIIKHEYMQLPMMTSLYRSLFTGSYRTNNSVEPMLKEKPTYTLRIHFEVIRAKFEMGPFLCLPERKNSLFLAMCCVDIFVYWIKYNYKNNILPYQFSHEDGL